MAAPLTADERTALGTILARFEAKAFTSFAGLVELTGLPADRASKATRRLSDMGLIDSRMGTGYMAHLTTARLALADDLVGRRVVAMTASGMRAFGVVASVRGPVPLVATPVAVLAWDEPDTDTFQMPETRPVSAVLPLPAKPGAGVYLTDEEV